LARELLYIGANTQTKEDEMKSHGLSSWEIDAALNHLTKNKGKITDFTGKFSVGQKVKYKGMTYTIYDFQADNQAPLGAYAILIFTRNAKKIHYYLLHDVPLDKLEV